MTRHLILVVALIKGCAAIPAAVVMSGLVAHDQTAQAEPKD